MRKVFWALYGVCWLAYINTCQASEINCYSGKTRIYHGTGYNIVTDNNAIMFTEYGSNNLILISADCVILEPLTWEQKKSMRS